MIYGSKMHQGLKRNFQLMPGAEWLELLWWIHGAFALEQGFLFSAMLLSATVVGVIERKWLVAAAWCVCAALLSAAGLMHSYQWTFGDTALKLAPAWPFVFGYTAMAVVFATAKWTTEESSQHDGRSES